jgi:D-alanyl-D-alanine carboxypeptidase
MAMSPLVPDEEEAAAAAAEEPATESEPADQPVAANDTKHASASAPVISSMTGTTSEIGQGDTSEQARPAAPAPTSDGKWGIQVGAHSSRDNAENQLRSVKTQMRDLLKDATSAIVPLDVNGNTFYRVRFGAFIPKKAEALCDQIQKRGVSCLVVTDGSWNQANASASRPIAVR